VLKKSGEPTRKPGNPDKRRPYREVDKSTLDAVVKRYISGESARSISEGGVISKPTLLKELRARGIAIRQQVAVGDDLIISEYLSGKSASDIESEYMTTKRHVGSVLRKNNIEFRVRNRIKTTLARAMACKKRAESIKRATPGWADSAAIKSIYNDARQKSMDTGVKHEVDHICPLHNDMVCGLHVQQNLRVITERENTAKKNKIDHVLLSR